VCPEAEGNDACSISLVELADLLRQIFLRDVRPSGMENVDDHLTPRQKAVCDEFAGTDSYWCIRHGEKLYLPGARELVVVAGVGFEEGRSSDAAPKGGL